jgi:hypothetical protein
MKITAARPAISGISTRGNAKKQAIARKRPAVVRIEPTILVRM